MMHLYPDDAYYYGPQYRMSPREYEYLRNKQAYERALEEERRRQYHMRRQQLEKERQRQAYIRMMEEEEAQERAALEREALRRRMMVKQQSIEEDTDESDEEPVFKYVQGPNGMIYRIPIEKEKNLEDVAYDFVRDWDGSIYRVPRRTRSKNAARKKQHKTQKAKNDNFNHMAQPRRPFKHYPDEQQGVVEEEESLPSRGLAPQKPVFASAVSHPTKKEQQRLKKKITVLVEDVESDTEEDELNSYWRNRHPSPGESWMEPVQL